MTVYSNFLFLLLSIPVISFIALALWNKKLSRNGDFIGIFAIGVSLLVSTSAFCLSIFNPSFHIGSKLSWLPVSINKKFFVNFSFDRLTAIMLIVVTLVSFLVHIFSIEYMKGDKRYGRYYASLSLFSFSMMGLVISSNLLFLYIFWELVGLSSYILIGHFFEKKSASTAAIKAFITTRVGDVGMLIGILICYFCIGTLDFNEIYIAINTGAFEPTYRFWFGICLFIAVMGKSAQFPLHVWLPDAMEGPTPASALIHAATMVAAGVYLLVRLFFVFDENTLLLIAYIGGFTSFFAATIAFVQDDIKKVLAYSTISQLGLMVLAVGIGSYTSGIFHLMTHAFFKAGLFLGAGAIISSMSHTQSMKEMGGLYKKMPFLTVCYLCCVLSISGVPFFSGFWSKDFILGDLFLFYKETGHPLLLFFGLSVTFFTSCYMFRQFFLVFCGSPRNKEKFLNIKNLSMTMKLPIFVLALFAIFVGGFNANWFYDFYNEQDAVLGIVKESVNIPLKENAHHIAMFFSIILSFSGIICAYLFYGERKNGKVFISPVSLKNMFPKIYNLLLNKYYIDEFYKVTILKSVFCLSKCCKFFDGKIDKVVNLSSVIFRKISEFIKIFDEKFIDNFCALGIAKFIKKEGDNISVIQTGNIREYILYSFIGLVFISAMFFFLGFL